MHCVHANHCIKLIDDITEEICRKEQAVSRALCNLYIQVTVKELEIHIKTECCGWLIENMAQKNVNLQFCNVCCVKKLSKN